MKRSAAVLLIVVAIIIGILLIVLLQVPKAGEFVTNLIRPQPVVYERCDGYPADAFEATVTSWDPARGTLLVLTPAGCELSLAIRPLEMAVIVPDVNAEGKRLERPVVTTTEMIWVKGFCADDRLRVEMKDSSPYRVRNLGPRACAGLP